MHSSYVVTDPKGTVLIECGKLLQRGGYKIKVLNTINFKKSMKYNPFAYLRSEKDILKLVKGTFSIYQLKHGDETRDLRFEPYDRLQVTGNVVDKANYELCLLISGDVLHQHRHICKPLFNAL